ncbi:MAG: hypothetical protein AAGA48_39040 [Myxococcota bacterium]
MMLWMIAAASAAEPEPTYVGTRWEVGRDVTVQADERAKDVIVVGGDIEVRGVVEGDAIAIGGNVRTADAGSVGNAVVIGGSARGANIVGNRVTVDDPIGAVNPEPQPLVVARSIYQQVVWLLVVASAAVLVSGVFPTQVRRVAEALESNPLRSGAVGLFTGGFVVLFSMMFAALTIGFGAPISLLLLGVLGVAWLLGIVGLSHAIGSRVDLGQTARSQWVAVLFGIVMMGMLTIVPVLGSVVLVVASSLAIGAAVLSWFSGGSIADPLETRQ